MPVGAPCHDDSALVGCCCSGHTRMGDPFHFTAVHACIERQFDCLAPIAALRHDAMSECAAASITLIVNGRAVTMGSNKPDRRGPSKHNGIRSSLSVPLTLEDNQLEGGFKVYGDEPDAFGRTSDSAGNLDVVTIDAYLNDLIVLSDLDHDLLAEALNEVYLERGQAYPPTYRRA